MGALYTIGHGSGPGETLTSRLRRREVSVVADVRSTPYSRFATQYNREELQLALRAEGLGYVFLGQEFGARRAEPQAFVAGRVCFERVAGLPSFRAGLDRIARGLERYSIALMCAEGDPLECHRAILVARHLDPGFPVEHILADGEIETHQALALRLCHLHGIDPDQHDLFAGPASREAAFASAFRLQGQRIAWQENI